MDPIEFGMVEGAMHPVEEKVFTKEEEGELPQNSHGSGYILKRGQIPTSSGIEQGQRDSNQEIIDKKVYKRFVKQFPPGLIIRLPHPRSLS